MNKWVLIIGSLLIIGIIGGILGYKFVYNKPHRDYEAAQPDYTLKAIALFEAYSNSRSDAELKYNGKVLEITGRVSSVETPDSLMIVVFTMREGMFGEEGIRCTLLPGHQSRGLKLSPGDEVIVKGYCTGYNGTDVIFEKCSITN